MSRNRWAGRFVSRRQFLAGLGALGAGAAAAVLPPRAGKLGDIRGAGRAEASHGIIHRPAEFEIQQRSVMAFPYKPMIWVEGHLPGAQEECGKLADAISQFQPVTLLAAPGQEEKARDHLRPGSTVEVVTMEYDDCWTRDTAGTSVFNGTQQTLLDWTFNCWGNKFGYCAAHSQLDDALPIPLSNHLGIARRPVDLVQEGGALQFDGEGTCMTTEQTQLNPNRNPGLTKAQIEAILKHETGSSKVIWLPWGDPADWITDGHIDFAALFVGPTTATQGAKVLFQTVPAGHPSYDAYQENKAVLQSATDAQGRPFQLLEFPFQGDAPFALTGTYSYINVRQCNDGGLIVPLLADAAQDRAAIAKMRDVFPDRTVVGVEVPNHTWAGGQVHCITQEVWP